MTSLLYTQEVNGIWRKRTVSLDGYNDEYMRRAVALWADPRIGNHYFVNSGSRSYLKQAALYALYKAGGNLAAKPGTSNHEYGSDTHPFTLAMDVNPMDGGSYNELHRVAYEYGFHFPLPSELWHMEMRPGRAPLPNVVKTQQEEDDMVQHEFADGAIIQMNVNGEVFCPELPGRPTAQHWGGMTQLRDDAKKSFSGKATVIAAATPGGSSQAGYVILDENWGLNGEFWKFDESAKQFLK